jgi:hypothetical protein
VKIAGLGLNLDGELLFKPQDEAAFADSLIETLDRDSQRPSAKTPATEKGVTYAEAVRPVLDSGDPRSVGWTYVLNEEDPQKGQIMEILRPLAESRDMADPDRPLLFPDTPEGEWDTWISKKSCEQEERQGKVPAYVLMVGTPQQLPFGLQTMMSTSANVGRLDFSSLDQLQTYADKLLRLEDENEKPVVTRDAIIFAPDGGPGDPTHYSRQYMALPMAEHVREKLALSAQEIQGDGATKGALVSALCGRPAFVYTASHGVGATDKSQKIQMKLNGAICCQRNGSFAESMFSADDVDHNKPFLEGSIFFQFACFGYGTPAKSEFAAWIKDVPKSYAKSDFTAALPRKLLSHPRGPIAYIGHLDIALLHSFIDARSPEIDGRWHSRIAPFKSAVSRILGLQPSGLAMLSMSARFNRLNLALTSSYQDARRNKLQWTPQSKAALLDQWLIRGDAQNYMVMGDPAARLRLPHA